MGEYHVKKWVEAIDSIDDYPLWLFDRKAMSIAINVCILIMLLSYVGILICVLNSCCQAVLPMLIASILAAILSVFFLYDGQKTNLGGFLTRKGGAVLSSSIFLMQKI